MKVSTLLKKAIRIAKDNGVKCSSIVFDERISIDDDSECMSINFFADENNFSVYVYDFDEKYTVEILLIRFEVKIKEFLCKGTTQDLEA